jgi:aminoglycoside phosphotransferase (APT) family kinase protein
VTLTEHIEANAARYFPDLPSTRPRVLLVSIKRRPTGELHHYRIEGNPRRELVVKIVDPNRARASPGRERPRLMPLSRVASRHEAEAEALTAAQAHFDRLGDPRFGTVRVLESLSSPPAILMERRAEPSLSDLLARSSVRRVFGGRHSLDEVFSNAGGWLHAYHGIPTDPGAPERHADRDAFVAAIDLFAEHLATRTGDVSFFADLSARARAASLTHLPERFPLALAHGDFAMRNILVAPDARVIVLDMRSRARVPVYFDIAYLLVALKAARPQLLSRGRAFGARRVAGYEQAFLAGYFGARSVPLGAIRLWEILVLMDRWAGILAAERRRGRSALAAGADRLVAGSLKALAAQLLKAV